MNIDRIVLYESELKPAPVVPAAERARARGCAVEDVGRPDFTI